MKEVPTGYVTQATIPPDLPCCIPCAKCGNAPNRIRWVPCGSDYSPLGAPRHWNEHMLHTCTCCGYEWKTKPLDKKGEEMLGSLKD